MSLHYLVKYEYQKSGGNLRNDVLLYYTFITQSSSERIVKKIGGTFGKVTGKMVIVSSAQFALRFYPQRCWSRQMS